MSNRIGKKPSLPSPTPSVTRPVRADPTPVVPGNISLQAGEAALRGMGGRAAGKAADALGRAEAGGFKGPGNLVGLKAEDQLRQSLDDFHARGEWEPLIEHFEAHRGTLSKVQVCFEKYLVALNKTKQNVRTIEEAQEYFAAFVPEGLPQVSLQGIDPLAAENRARRDLNGEILSAVGKAFRELSNAGEDGFLKSTERRVIAKFLGFDPTGVSVGRLRRNALELSTKNYEAAFFADRSFYGAINAAHGNYRLGNMARAERFAWMAQASMKDGEHGGGDYWLNATRLEAALLTGDFSDAHNLFQAAAAQCEHGWMADTTARTLQDDARIYRRSANVDRSETAVIDTVVTQLQALTAKPELRDDAAWMSAAVQEIARASGAEVGQSKGDPRQDTLPAAYAKLSNEIFKRTVDVDWRHREVDLDKLYQQAGPANEELRALARSIAAVTGGEAMFPPGTPDNPGGLKGRPRAEQKVKDFAGDCAQLVDIARASIAFDSLDSVYRALGMVDDKAEIVGIKDRFLSPYNSGYRDLLLKVRMGNGHVVELQLHLKGILDVKNGPGHALYESQRDLWTKAEREGRPLTADEKQQVAGFDAQMKALYDQAYDASSRSPRLSKAEALATKAHAGQMYGPFPYAYHLEWVTDILRDHGASETALAAATLHDAVEDSRRVTLKDIAADCGPDVARIVGALSRRPGERATSYFERVRAAGPQACLVKLADRIVNVSSCALSNPDPERLERYRGEQAALRTALYRPEHEALWAQLDTLLGRPKAPLDPALGHKSRTEKHASYPDRAEVPAEARSPSEPAPGYRPIRFVSKSVIENDRSKKPNGWADPAVVPKEELAARSTYLGDGKLDLVPMTDQDGAPIRDAQGRLAWTALNPVTRTGLKGRGQLGKYGPNFAADAVVMRDPVGRAKGPMTARQREAMRGYADDPRNTDEAWIETSVHLFDFTGDTRAVNLKADMAEVTDVGWFKAARDGDALVILDREGAPLPLYANHESLLANALKGVPLDGAGKEILLILRENGEWALPGGMQDEGETGAQAALRELGEEAGASVRTAVEQALAATRG